ncbi:MAG: hypothetical protein JXA25_13230 [Anaerolineales bacterium]|nr:hypothetical protein [Anaerolineales bacterium]
MNTKRMLIPVLILSVLVLTQAACGLIDWPGGNAGEEAAENGLEIVEQGQNSTADNENSTIDVTIAGQTTGSTPGENVPGENNPGNQTTPPQNQNNPYAQNAGCTNGFELDGSPLVSTGAQFDPGEIFEAGWTLRNTGTCTWDSAYELVMIGGENMGASSVQFSGEVVPGDTITLTVELQAPAQAGTYLTAWKLEDGSGFRFGMDNPANAPLKVNIEVASSSSSTLPEMEVAPNLDMSNFPNVFDNGVGQTMTTNQCYDFEGGSVVSCSGGSADFRYNYTVGQGGELTGLNGTRFSASFSGAPAEEDLPSATFYSDPVPLAGSGPSGRYYGFTTEIDGKTAYGWILPTAYNQSGFTFSYLVFEPDTSPVTAAAMPELNLSLFILTSEEQESVLVDRCYDLENGTKATCSGTDADIKYTWNTGTGTLQFLNGTQQSIGDDEAEPDKAACQADSYMSGYNFIYETPADYNCFTTYVNGDLVYGWYRVTAYNSSGMTFDYLIWEP